MITKKGSQDLMHSKHLEGNTDSRPGFLHVEPQRFPRSSVALSFTSNKKKVGEGGGTVKKGSKTKTTIQHFHIELGQNFL